MTKHRIKSIPYDPQVLCRACDAYKADGYTILQVMTGPAQMAQMHGDKVRQVQTLVYNVLMYKDEEMSPMGDTAGVDGEVFGKRVVVDG